jgi:hypothetical protein
MLSDILNPEGSYCRPNASLSLPRGMAFEIVVTGDRSEARRYIGGPVWIGGLRSSIPPPLDGTIGPATSRIWNRLEPIPVEVVSQRSGTGDIIKIKNGKIRFKRQWVHLPPLCGSPVHEQLILN